MKYLTSKERRHLPLRTKAKFWDSTAGKWCLIQGTDADLEGSRYKGFEIEKSSQVVGLDQAFEILRNQDGNPDPLTPELASKLELVVSSGEYAL